jgi:hypothetical protein
MNQTLQHLAEALGQPQPRTADACELGSNRSSYSCESLEGHFL